MSNEPLPKLRKYYPTYDDEEGDGMYERNHPNGWHSSAEVKALKQAIVQRLKEIQHNDSFIEQSRLMDELIKELECGE